MLRIAAVLSASIALAGGLTACGGSSPAGSASTSGSRTDQMFAFAKCMRANGVANFPDPGAHGIQIQAKGTPGQPAQVSVDGVSVNGPAFQAASAQCRRYLPNGGHPSAAQLQRLKAGALAMARCMRSHGVPNFPDPQVTEGPGGGAGIRIGVHPGSGVDPSSPAFQAAIQKCRPLIPGKGARGGGPA